MTMADKGSEGDKTHEWEALNEEGDSSKQGQEEGHGTDGKPMDRKHRRKKNKKEETGEEEGEAMASSSDTGAASSDSANQAADMVKSMRIQEV